MRHTRPDDPLHNFTDRRIRAGIANPLGYWSYWLWLHYQEAIHRGPGRHTGVPR